MESKPRLIEISSKSYIKNVLNTCKLFREKHINFLFNICLLIIFLIILGIILYARYKGNISEEEKKIKEKKEKEYILSKLTTISQYRKKKSENMITDLPNWFDSPETLVLNR